MSVKRPLIRNVAIVGPYLSGKTSLLESLLYVSGVTNRKGSIVEGNTIGDHTPEARERQMSVELNTAHLIYQDVGFTFLDCPGSVEFIQETYNTLIGVDAAIVVCEPVVDRVLNLSPLFKFLDDWNIPHVIFLNKLDRADVDYMQVLMALKSVSSRPLVPQHYPMGRGESLEGYIDLITEKAYRYGEQEDRPIAFPKDFQLEEQIARTELLETLANHDDHLLEELLEDIRPSEEEILQDLKQDLSKDYIVPVLVGVADRNFGVKALLDALIQECPEASETNDRRGFKPSANQTIEPIAQVLKTYYSQQGGKLSLVRVWQGELTDGMKLGNVRIGGMYKLSGGQQNVQHRAVAGSIVALARLENVQTGETLSDRGVELKRAETLTPVFALAITPEKRNDEVKLSAALTKLLEEDPALHWQQHGDTHEVILWGQGEIHLQVALDRLRRKYNLPMSTHLPQVAYKETIRHSTHVRGRYKHQTGGHGQFGDVQLDINPQARGQGFEFKESIVPGVETGVREFLNHGPLGYPIVDISVTLTDGAFHNVDSSEQAFKQAARIAMQEGMPKCDSVLLEPIVQVTLSVPIDFTSKVLRLVSGRRGQILGYDAKDGWMGWDEVSAQIPEAEMQDLIVELRSLTFGVGHFSWEYDHLQEVPERIADRVLAR
jgi:elongation factor G